MSSSDDARPDVGDDGEAPAPPEDVPAVSAEDLVDGEVRDPEDARRYPSTLGGALYLLCLIAVGVGIVVVSTGPWRQGISIVGGALIAAAAFRLLLRRADAGMLAVRNKLIDVVLLSGVGAALLVLARFIPNQPG